MRTMLENSALILVDIQEGFHDPYWGPRNHPRFEESVVRLTAIWRSAKGRVIHVQHLSQNPSSPLAPLKVGSSFMACATPADGEVIFRKNVNSAFIGTGLEGYLREHSLSHLVFAGMTTDHCVSTSVRMAKNLGFSPCVVADATATFDRVSHDGKRFGSDLVHSVSLASLKGEFARVTDVDEVQQYIEGDVLL